MRTWVCLQPATILRSPKTLIGMGIPLTATWGPIALVTKTTTTNLVMMIPKTITIPVAVISATSMD